MDRLIESGGLTEAQAKDTLKAGMDDFDYSNDADDAATEDMRCWADSDVSYSRG